jgi:hypothetical protein
MEFYGGNSALTSSPGEPGNPCLGEALREAVIAACGARD